MSQSKNKLEEYIASRFKELYKYARPTKGSGSGGEAGDINQPYFIIECKLRNTVNATINRNVWKKLIKEIPIGSKRLPLLILENKFEERFVVIDFEDFFNIFKENINGQQENK
jgi:hypothetical protein